MLSFHLSNPLLPLHRHSLGCYSSNSLHVSSSSSSSIPAPFAFTKHKCVTPPFSFLQLKFKTMALHEKSWGREEEEKEKEEEDLEFQVLTAVRSIYNEIVILDTPESRVLLLDSTNNVHSIINKGDKWTGSYWDEFATLPAIIPRGHIGILGLGGGTAAHLMLHLWPSSKLEGWEIDEILIDKARDYLWMSDMEKSTEAGGILNVHVGDALSSSANVPGGFSGIIVDLFSDGKVLPQLQEVATWLELNNRLMPRGRIMVNCGGFHAGALGSKNGITDPKISSSDSLWNQNTTIKALCKAFPGNLSWKRLEECGNFLALTGPLPDLNAWSAAVPDRLSSNAKQWKPCGSISSS